MADPEKTGMVVDRETQDESHGYEDYERILDSNRKFLSSLIDSMQLKEARQLLITLESWDIAQIISQMKDSEKIIAYRILPQEVAIDVFSQFEVGEQEEFLQNFSNEEAREILENMNPDDRTELLEELPAIVVKRLMKLLSQEERRIAQSLLNYKSDTAGRLMTPEYIDLEEDLTVKEALDAIRKEAPGKETIYTLYVIDRKQKLTGVVSLRNIILAEPKQKISEIMTLDPIKVYTYQDQNEVSQVFKDYDLLALPVVDLQERLVGIVTFDDAFDVIEEENTEDFQKIVAIQPTDEGYLKSNFWKLIFNRVIWVLALMLVGSVSQDIIFYYQKGMDAQFYASLSLFFTVLIGVGGNIGSQSSILVIRGLATGEISRHDTWKLLGRSLLMGLVLGAILAGFMIVRIFIFKTGFAVRWEVSAALAMLVAISNFLGALLPVLIKRIGIDPALISTPLITTIIDIGGLVLYFEISKLILGLA